MENLVQQARPGDRVFTEVSVQPTPNENYTALTLLETHIITGGSGRFTDAKGTITVKRVLDLATFLSSGTITLS